MALTAAQQILFSRAAALWLAEQHRNGNQIAEYQLRTAPLAQVKNVIGPYLDAIKATDQGYQTTAAVTRAAEDTQWSSEISDCDAITNTGSL